MHFRHHAGDPSHVEILAARAGFSGQKIADVVLHRRLPEALVRHVDGEFAGVFRHLHVAAGENETALFAVEGEHVRATAESEHQDGARAVHGVAGADLRAAGLQEMFVARLGHTIRAAQYRKDGADRNVDVDIGTAVERIEQQQVVAARIAAWNGMCMFHFLRGQTGQMTAPFIGFQQDFVAQHIELLLGFSLHIAGAGIAQYVTQGTFADRG